MFIFIKQLFISRKFRILGFFFWVLIAFFLIWNMRNQLNIFLCYLFPLLISFLDKFWLSFLEKFKKVVYGKEKPQKEENKIASFIYFCVEISYSRLHDHKGPRKSQRHNYIDNMTISEIPFLIIPSFPEIIWLLEEWEEPLKKENKENVNNHE